jgi:endonuclease/exonuclease/phosphatase family metal-dependent hydrolase
MSGSRSWRGAAAAGAVALAGCVGPHRTMPDPGGRACDRLAGGGVDWYVPADPGDRRALGPWCAAVGPEVVDSVPAGDAWAAGGDSLRLLVWNMSAGGGALESLLRREAGLRCGTPGPPGPPFVLLAQEAYRRSDRVPAETAGTRVSAAAAERPRDGPREDVVTVARRCGLALFYVPAVRNGRRAFPDGREDRGNALLANVPLRDLVAIELPAEDSRRLAIGATVLRPGGDSVRLLSFHFTLLPRLWRNLTTGNAARIRHALGMVDALTRIEEARGVAGGIATIAAGDANTWSRGDAALRRLGVAFPDSPPFLAGGTRGPFPADHLLYRRAARDGSGTVRAYRRLASDYGSDHHPLAAVYVFPP